MPKKKSKIQDPLNGDKISKVLAELPGRFNQERVSIADLRNELSGRIYGLFMLVLALPNLIPMPAPGLSLIMGLPLLFLTTQLAIGVKTPWFPSFIAKRQVRLSKIERICKAAVPYIKKIEKYITPRFKWLVKSPADRIIALICLALAIILILPVPFGNALPALAICLFAIAILQRDGLFAIIGLVFAAISVTILAFSFSAVILFINKII